MHTNGTRLRSTSMALVFAVGSLLSACAVDETAEVSEEPGAEDAVASTALASLADVVDYDFTVCTCDVNNAGTDANIYTTLTGIRDGAEVHTSWLLLDYPGLDDNERGACTTYSGALGLRNQVNIGTPWRLTISNDGSNNKPGWAMCSYSVTMHIHDGTTKTFAHYAASPEWTDGDYGWQRDFYGFAAQ